MVPELQLAPQACTAQQQRTQLPLLLLLLARQAHVVRVTVHTMVMVMV